ncbi:hypothetical protein F53441_3595 [Fusarium austroafricanum]|uniref:Uncharacterized protein n=1 Tax=Fusarium austroafricanum TaxID=2364996 RepID=A0A8H4KQB4_9HYPO|nr:hypothetical protein F53441_3595 [Fusarium austroafricanum]
MSSGPTTSGQSNGSSRNPQYIDLGANAPEPWSMWSNDPTKMKLSIYFSQDPNAPGLAQSYNLPGLKPVVVKQRGTGRGDIFLLKDDTTSYFLFDEEKNDMYRFLRPLTDEEAVYQVETDTYDVGNLSIQFYVRRRQ